MVNIIIRELYILYVACKSNRKIVLICNNNNIAKRMIQRNLGAKFGPFCPFSTIFERYKKYIFGKSDLLYN